MEQTKKLKDVYKICTSLLSKREQGRGIILYGYESFIMKTTKTGISQI